MKYWITVIVWCIGVIGIIGCTNQSAPVSVSESSGESVTLAIALPEEVVSVVAFAYATVKADDMNPITSALTLYNNMLTGRINNIPAGKDRIFTVKVYDTDSTVRYSGSVSTEIISGEMAKVIIYLQKATGGAVIEATIQQDTVSTPPHIILVYGDSLLTLPVNTPWVDPGFVAVDALDGSISADQVVVDSSELVANLGIPGMYVVTYTVTNSLGLTTTAERRVRVVAVHNDTLLPVIILLGDNPDTVTMGTGEYCDPGYTVIDNWGVDLTASVVRSGTVDMKRIGKYTLVYSVTDTAGNRANVKRTVWVIPDNTDDDVTPPVITLQGKNPDTLVVDSASVYKEPGYTAIDNRDGNISEKTERSGTVDIKTPGRYQLYYTVSDGNDNRCTVVRNVVVLDHYL